MTKTCLRITLRCVAFVVFVLAALPLAAQTPQGNAFTYQGELRQNGAPITNTSPGVDMVFQLWNAPTGGSLIGPTLNFTAATGNPVAVVNGIFTVALDFGAPAFIALVSDARYLAVTVSGNALVPRTKIENAPYALQSSAADLAYSVSNASIGAAQINSAQVQQRVAGTCASGSSIQSIGATGTVTCQNAVTAVTGATGSGLTSSATGSAVTLGTDTSVLQVRVSGVCAAGSTISTVNADGTVGCLAVTVPGTTWNLAGNAGNAANNFLGTTDTQPLTFKVNNSRVGQITPSGDPTNFTDATNVVLGASGNTVGTGTNAVGATVGGGGSAPNKCANGTSFCSNSATEHFATVGGGAGNGASGFWATVGGGTVNGASGAGATVGGGSFNVASGSNATVGGGGRNGFFNGNQASGTDATIGGGYKNTASGDSSTVGGGYLNSAGGDYSFAAGQYAMVRNKAAVGGTNTTGDQGTFVWADDSVVAAFTSTGPNQFLIRAAGGVGINTNNPTGVALLVGTNTNNGNGAFLSNGGTWTNVSSRTLKEAFAYIDPGTILEKLIALPIGTWSYKNDAVEGTHLGPVAEDFKAAFDLGNNERSIATVDEEGVALAAIQGLNAKLEKENAELRERLERIEAQLGIAERQP